MFSTKEEIKFMHKQGTEITEKYNCVNLNVYYSKICISALF